MENGEKRNSSLDHTTALSEQLRRDPGLPVTNPTVAHWQIPPNLKAQHQSTRSPADTDVVIIGSGITGCSVAKQILEQQKDIRVTILEARTITSGATGRNGGHIKAVPEISYSDLLPKIGKTKAQEVVHFTLKNVQELFEVAKALPEGFREYSEVHPVETLNIFTDEESFRHVKDVVKLFDEDNPDLKARTRIIERGELIEVRQLFVDVPSQADVMQKHGVKNAVGGTVSSAGAAWPYRLITSILGHLLHQYPSRLTIESNTSVQSIEYDTASERYTVQTSRGHFHAQYVVHATNGKLNPP